MLSQVGNSIIPVAEIFYKTHVPRGQGVILWHAMQDSLCLEIISQSGLDDQCQKFVFQ